VRTRPNVSALLAAVSRTEDCVVPDCRLERDGRVILTYDGLRISLHRLIWLSVGLPMEQEDYLIRRCITFGCIHPHHYEKSNRPYIRVECPNHHRYGDDDILANGTRRCHICAEARAARRQRRGGEPNWARELRRKFCPQAHPYTPENTYIEITPAGRQKRHCRTCVIARRRGLDPADADVVAA
jgi:hypothetical protein